MFLLFPSHRVLIIQMEWSWQNLDFGFYQYRITQFLFLKEEKTPPIV